MKRKNVLLYLLLLAAFCSKSEARIENAEPVALVEPVATSDISHLPTEYLQLKFDIESSSGRGKTYQIQFSKSLAESYPEEEKMYSGPMFLVEHLPQQISSHSKMLFLRDAEILSQLSKLLQKGISIVVLPHTRTVDAAVFDSHSLFNQQVVKAVTRGEQKSLVLAITPQMTRDILKHEIEHLSQNESDHTLAKYLASLNAEFSINQMKTIRIVLAELMSYRAQYEYILEMQSKGLTEVLEFKMLTENNKSTNLADAAIQNVELSAYAKERILNMRFTLSMNLGFLFQKVRSNATNAGSYVRMVNIIRENLARMGEVGSYLSDEYSHHMIGD